LQGFFFYGKEKRQLVDPTQGEALCNEQSNLIGADGVIFRAIGFVSEFRG